MRRNKSKPETMESLDVVVVSKRSPKRNRDELTLREIYFVVRQIVWKEQLYHKKTTSYLNKNCLEKVAGRLPFVRITQIENHVAQIYIC